MHQLSDLGLGKPDPDIFVPFEAWFMRSALVLPATLFY